MTKNWQFRCILRSTSVCYHPIIYSFLELKVDLLHSWFHPPDGATFDAPYVDKEIWEEIARSVEREWNGLEKLAKEESKTAVAGKKTSKAEKNEFERETSGNRVKISVQELVKKKRKQDTTVAPLPAKVEAYMGGDGSERQKKKARRNPRTRRRHKALLQKA
jgi:hypothetical protein